MNYWEALRGLISTLGVVAVVVVVGLLFSCCASPSLLFRGSEEVTKEDMLDFARMYTKRYLRGAEYWRYKDGVGQVRGTLV